MGWLNELWNEISRKKHRFTRRRKDKKNGPHHRTRVFAIEPLEARQLLSVTPTVLPISAVNVLPGTTDSSVNLAAVINNPNGPLSQLTFTVVANSNQSLVPAAWIEDQTLEFAAVQGKSGTSDVTIRATDSAGQSVQATIPIVETALPTAPTGLTATAASASEIDLTWADTSSNETGIKVQRSTNSAFTQNVTLVMTAAAGAASCSDTGLGAGTTYYYRVLATNAAGNSPASSTAKATTQAAVAVPVSGRIGTTTIVPVVPGVHAGSRRIAALRMGRRRHRRPLAGRLGQLPPLRRRRR